MIVGLSTEKPDTFDGLVCLAVHHPACHFGTTGTMHGINVGGKILSAFCRLVYMASKSGMEVHFGLRSTHNEFGAHDGYDFLAWLNPPAGLHVDGVLEQLENTFKNEIVRYYANLEDNKKPKAMPSQFHHRWKFFTAGETEMVYTLARYCPGAREMDLRNAPVRTCFYKPRGVQFDPVDSDTPDSIKWLTMVSVWQLEDFDIFRYPHVMYSDSIGEVSSNPATLRLVQELSGLSEDEQKGNASYGGDSQIDRLPRLANPVRKLLRNFKMASSEDDGSPVSKKSMLLYSLYMMPTYVSALWEAIQTSECMSSAQAALRDALNSVSRSEFGDFSATSAIWFLRHLAPLERNDQGELTLYGRVCPPELWLDSYILAGFASFHKLVGSGLIAKQAMYAVLDATNMSPGLGLNVIFRSVNGQTGKSTAAAAGFSVVVNVVDQVTRVTVASLTAQQINGRIANEDAGVTFFDDLAEKYLLETTNDSHAQEWRANVKNFLTSNVASSSTLTIDKETGARILQKNEVSYQKRLLISTNAALGDGEDKALVSRFLDNEVSVSEDSDKTQARMDEAMSAISNMREGPQRVGVLFHLFQYMTNQCIDAGILPPFTTYGASFILSVVLKEVKKAFGAAALIMPRVIDRLMRISQIHALNRLCASMVMRKGATVSTTACLTIEDIAKLGPQMVIGASDVLAALTFHPLVDPGHFAIKAAVLAAALRLIKAKADDSYFLSPNGREGLKNFNYLAFSTEELVNQVLHIMPSYMGGETPSLPTIYAGLDSLCTLPAIPSDEFFRIYTDPSPWALGEGTFVPGVGMETGNTIQVLPFRRSRHRFGSDQFIIATKLLEDQLVVRDYRAPLSVLGKLVSENWEASAKAVVKALDKKVDDSNGKSVSHHTKLMRKCRTKVVEHFTNHLSVFGLDPHDYIRLDLHSRVQLIQSLSRFFFWDAGFEVLINPLGEVKPVHDHVKKFRKERVVKLTQELADLRQKGAEAEEIVAAQEELAAAQQLSQEASRGEAFDVYTIMCVLLATFDPTKYKRHFSQMATCFLKNYVKVPYTTQLGYNKRQGEGTHVDWFFSSEREMPAEAPHSNMILETRRDYLALLKRLFDNKRGFLQRTINGGAKITNGRFDTGLVEMLTLGAGTTEDVLYADDTSKFVLHQVDHPLDALGQRDNQRVKEKSRFEGSRSEIEMDIDSVALDVHWKTHGYQELAAVTERELKAFGEKLVSPEQRQQSGSAHLHGHPVWRLLPLKANDVPETAQRAREFVERPDIPLSQPEDKLACFDVDYMRWLLEALEKRKIPPKCFGLEKFTIQDMPKVSCHPWVVSHFHMPLLPLGEASRKRGAEHVEAQEEEVQPQPEDAAADAAAPADKRARVDDPDDLDDLDILLEEYWKP